MNWLKRRLERIEKKEYIKRRYKALQKFLNYCLKLQTLEIISQEQFLELLKIVG